MATITPMVCPVVVGRDEELARLAASIDRAVGGEGGVVVVVGEAGAGKSRVCREVLADAASRGLAVLSGRAIDGEIAVPYRPITEAFLAAFRSGGPPEAPELVGFEGHLGRIVPAWQVDAQRGADESPVLLGEAVARLLRVVAGTAGAVVLLEDIHWADVETLAVIDYLADALVGERVLCLVTCRPDSGSGPLDRTAADTVARMRRHHAANVVALDPLNDVEIARVVAASLGGGVSPPEVDEFVVAHAEGNPFLAEELLAGLVATGALVEDGGWRVTAPLTPTVPTDVARSVRTRMSALAPETRRVIGAAAVLGRRFDWNLVPGVAEVDGRAVVEALREAVDAQLVDVDGHEFRFRHSLSREAVLDALLPPERAELSRRAWPAIEHAHPGLPGPWCELAAELAAASGEPAVAAGLLVESARRAFRSGALATAQSTVERARVLAAGTAQLVDADECFVQITSLAGRPADALSVGIPLVARMEADDVPSPRLVGLLVVLARAAVAAGDLAVAEELVERARTSVSSDEHMSELAAVEAIAAHVALGADDLTAAEALARSAVEHATAQGQPAVACEALEVLGRVGRIRSAEEAMSAFERAAAIAEANDLPGWLIRARHELALERWIDGDTAGLTATRELADRHGAMVTVAVMDLSLADIALSSFDRERCLERAQACVDASRRYGLATLPVAELWLAGGHALAGDDAAMEEAIERALARDPDDPRILGDLWGRVRATRSMVRDDRDQVVADLDRMMEYVDVAPLSTSIFPNRLVWLVVHSIDDDDLGVAAQRKLQGLRHLEWWTLLSSVLDIARAITLGREGRADEAADVVAGGLTTTAQLAVAGGSAHYLHLLLAEAQIRDGWGEPVALLRPAEAFFGERGYDAIARRCRVALGSAGEKMPRRGRGDSTVPERLRALGITSRELDVAELIVRGLSNREIATHLHISPKTVERHVGSLFDRTGIRNRTDLAAWVVAATD